jgi:hypothetical protein
MNAKQNAFKFEVAGEDDDSKYNRAIAATQKLITCDKHAMVGNSFSKCSLAMVPITPCEDPAIHGYHPVETGVPPKCRVLQGN